MASINPASSTKDGNQSKRADASNIESPHDLARPLDPSPFLQGGPAPIYDISSTVFLKGLPPPMKLPTDQEIDSFNDHVEARIRDMTKAMLEPLLHQAAVKVTRRAVDEGESGERVQKSAASAQRTKVLASRLSAARPM